MQGSANQCAYANAVSKTIPEHNSVADGTPAADATAARRPQQPPAAVVPSWWTEERIETLKEHWSVGDSATIIAAAMHTTRNAILGKVHRLGLESRQVIREVAKVYSIPRRCSRTVFPTRGERKLNIPKPQSPPKIMTSVSVITGAMLNRKRLPPIAEMTKNQLRAMLTQALVNTAKLAIVP